MIMQVAVSSVNSGLNENPSAVKKPIEALRFFTGRFTKIFLDIDCSFLLRIDDSLKSAVHHALYIERHLFRIAHRAEARILHDFRIH